jgi:DNA (cytosine-5)-methyltransferase 1
MTLGSLFSGSGGFELAGVLAGITPVWNAEIEPFPCKVTAARFPNVKNYGDVTKIDGSKVEPVDIITLGSPCQDISVAGKQVGIQKGTRSSLFFEAIRIVREMLEATDYKYPRYLVWENVPGAFSSNKGDDFRSVLQSIVDLKDPLSDVPKPKKWGNAGCIVGDGYSIAWRIYDAQYWGVPQRRKRIYLIGCLGDERAGEILFKPESLRGNTTESRKTGKGAAADAQRSTDGSSHVYCLQGNGIDRADTAGCNGRGWREFESYTLNTIDRPAVCYAIDSVNSNSMKSSNPNSGFHREDIARTLDTKCDPTCNQGGNVIVGHVTAYQERVISHMTTEDIANPINATDYKGPQLLCYGIENHAADSRVTLQKPEDPIQTLTSRMGTGGGNVPLVLMSTKEDADE